MRNRACPEPSPGTGRSAPRPGVASPPSEFCPWVVCLDFSDTLYNKLVPFQPQNAPQPGVLTSAFCIGGATSLWQTNNMAHSYPVK